MMNKFSLNSTSYEITKVQWNIIKKEVVDKQLTHIEAIEKYKLNIVIRDDKEVVDNDICKLRVWFLYDVLLQEKYNHLYKREKLTSAVLNDFVYCDYDGFGRGEIVAIYSDNLMAVKFKARKLNTMCSSSTFTTVHDGIKRKITKL